MIIVSDKFLDFFSWFFKIGGMTIYPFIIVRENTSDRTIRHEQIHLKQYSELLVVGFLFVYLFDWLHGLIKYRSAYKAYKQIRMEQEAYIHSVDPIYVEFREHYSWWGYKV